MEIINEIKKLAKAKAIFHVLGLKNKIDVKEDILDYGTTHVLKLSKNNKCVCFLLLGTEPIFSDEKELVPEDEEDPNSRLIEKPKCIGYKRVGMILEDNFNEFAENAIKNALEQLNV